MLFLKHFPGLINKSPSDLLKTCLLLVAGDTRKGLEKARLEYEEKNKDSDTTVSGEPTTTELQPGERSGNEDQQSDNKVTEGPQG